jgi:hypothetical protein
MMKKAILSAALAGALCSGAVAQNLPGAMEAMRGRLWNGSECCGWKWDWTQVSGPRFRGTFRNPNGQVLNEDNIMISINGSRVEITRAGGSSAGGCTYEGTIRVGAAAGDYWCAGQRAGQWSATISSPANMR